MSTRSVKTDYLAASPREIYAVFRTHQEAADYCRAARPFDPEIRIETRGANR